MPVYLKILVVGIGIALVGARAGEDEKSRVVPQPRARIDPSLLVDSPVPAKATGNPTFEGGLTLLPKYVVRENSLTPLLLRRPGVEDPRGKFTLKNGGRFVAQRVGPFSVELGIWPHVDIMEPKAPAKCLDFVRVKW